MNKQQEKIYNELISKYNFDEDQKEQIKLGIEKDLKIKWYTNPEFTHYQMEEIFLGLENNIDISFYLNPDIDWGEMRRIRLKLKDKK